LPNRASLFVLSVVYKKIKLVLWGLLKSSGLMGLNAAPYDVAEGQDRSNPRRPSQEWKGLKDTELDHS